MEEMLKRDGITVKPGKEILLWLKPSIRRTIATAQILSAQTVTLKWQDYHLILTK
ncbi:MAG: hypothetical protein ACLRZ6_10560 [Lachnospiraceae bacterium]